MRDLTSLLLAGEARVSAHSGQSDASTDASSETRSLLQYLGERQDAFERDFDLDAVYLRRRFPKQVSTRRQKVARASAYETGLSNTAYWAASSGTQKLRVKITPARVKLTISDPFTDLLLPDRRIGGHRGIITELSDAARDRLVDRAATLEAEGRIPEVMR